MATKILTGEQVRKLFADAYYDVALTCEADMVVVTGVLEMIRNEFLNGNPYNLWSHINFSKYKSDHEKLKAFLLRLKNNYRKILFETLCSRLDEAFERSGDEGWKLWFDNYVEAMVCWNEVHHRLGSRPFPFPAGVLPVVEDLRRLNQLILENRWIDATPLLQMFMDHELIQPHQRAYLQVITAEVYLFHLLKNEEALKRLQEASKVIPGSSRLKRVFAEYYEKTGDLESCRKEIFEAIFNDSNDIDNYLTMGDTYRDAGAIDVAEKWYRDATEINCIDGAPYTRLVAIYGSTAKFEEKNKEIPSLLAAAEALSPDSEFNGLIYDGYRDAGSYYFTNQRNPESIECYEKAITMHPNWVTAYIDVSYVLIAENNFDEAGKKIKKALKIDPKYYDGKLAHAWLEEQKSIKGPEKEKKKSILKAIELYQECISLRPSTADNFYNTIGVLYGNIDDYNSSRDFYRKAIDADPKADARTSALYQSNLAYAYNKLQDYENAKKACLRAIELDPDDPLIYNKLGNIHFACKEFEKAKENYIKAIERKKDEPVYHENLGKANFELGNWQEAIDAYNECIAVNTSGVQEKQHALIYDNMGTAFDKLGNKEAAERSLLKAIEIDPEDYLIHNKLGILYYGQNKNEQALKYFMNAQRMGRGEAVLPGNVGLAYVRLGHWQQATEAFKQALLIEPDNPFYLNYAGLCYYRQKEYDDAIHYYKKAIEKDPSEPVYFDNLGLAYEDAGLLSEAKSIYQKLIKQWPQNFTYHGRLAAILVKEGNTGEAIKIMEKGVSDNPDDIETLRVMGEFQQGLKLPGEALRTYQHALTIAPGDELLNNNIGVCYHTLKEDEKAIPYYQKAIEANPHVALYYQNLGLSYFDLKQWENSIEAHEQALTLEPNYRTYNFAGVAYYNLGEYDKAIEHYKKSIDAGGKEAVIYNNLALAYDRSYQTKEAEEYYLKAVETEPENYLYQNSMGVFYYLNRDYDNAIRHYKEAIKFGNGEEILFENLGLAYEDAGKPGEALETYQYALTVHPGNEVFLDKVAALKK